MASCVLCASLLDANHSDIRFITRDEARSHAAQHLSQTKRLDEENCNSLEQVFEQCFPNFVVMPVRKEKKIVVKKEGRLSLLNVCHILFKGRISKASPRAKCKKCGSGIVLYGEKSGCQFGLAINHASAHLGIDLFECRKCGCSFSSRSSVRRHLISSHGLRYLTEYYTDKSGGFIAEITNILKQCFTEGNNNGPSDEKAPLIRLRGEAAVRSHTKGSKLAIERQLFCYRLIRQLAGDDGKIQCRLCPKRITIKQVSRCYQVHYALSHALVHLKKPLFRCNVCLNVSHTRDSLSIHLKSVHALPLRNNYDCLVDEFHADVLDMLRKCYAQECGK